MEELSAKIRWNAMIAYFMVFVSIFFLISKDKNVSHHFVKSHVKSAFVLHLLFALILFVMSYDFWSTLRILDYSLNSIITALAMLFIFMWILYGMYMAQHGKRVTLGEIFWRIWIPKNIMPSHASEHISEESYPILILSHVPFIWYMLYGQHKNIPHIRDIVMLNFIVTLLSCFFFIIWYFSLASLLMLGYIIYSVAACISLVMNGVISSRNLDIVPGAEKIFLMQKSVFIYIWNTLRNKKHQKFSEIIEYKIQERKDQERKDQEEIKIFPHSKLPASIFYIPFINIIWIFSSATRGKFHLRNGLVLTLVTTFLIILLWKHISLLIFVLFPVFFGIWYTQRDAYRIPYMYDIYSFYAALIRTLWKVFHITRELQKTDIKHSIKIWEQTIKKEKNTQKK